jgi:hypothetical protein
VEQFMRNIVLVDKFGAPLKPVNRYDAAKSNRSFDMGYIPSAINSEEKVLTQEDREIIAARILQSYRNNPFVAAIASVLPTHIGIPSVKSLLSVNADEKDAARLGETDDIIDDLIEDWFDNMTPMGDSLHDLNIMFWHLWLSHGEVFIYLRADGLIQLIDPIEIGSHSTNKIPAGFNETQGVIHKQDGTVVAYRRGKWVGNQFTYQGGDLIEAKYVIHYKHKNRANQFRGVPVLAPMAKWLRHIDDCVDAKVLSVKAQAVFAVWVKRAQSTLADTSTEPVEDLITGSINYGNAGEEPVMIETKSGSQDFLAFTDDIQQQCLAPLMIPLEAIKGYNKSSYASGRNTWQQYGLAIKWKYRRPFQKQVLRKLIEWRKTLWIADGTLKPHDLRAVDYYYPALPSADPYKDSLQDSVDLQNGFVTQAEILQRRGCGSFQLWLRARVKELKAIVDYANKYNIPLNLLLPPSYINMQQLLNAENGNTNEAKSSKL